MVVQTPLNTNQGAIVPPGGMPNITPVTPPTKVARYDTTTTPPVNTPPVTPPATFPAPANTVLPPDPNAGYTSALTNAEKSYSDALTTGTSGLQNTIQDQFQNEIDAVNKQYNLLSTQSAGAARAKAAATGELGSGLEDSGEIGAEEDVENQRQTAIAQVQDSIDNQLLSAEQLDVANKKADVDSLTANANTAMTNLTTLASAQVPLSSLSPDAQQKLFQASGIDSFSEFTNLYNAMSKTAASGVKPINLGANGTIVYNPATASWTTYNIDPTDGSITSNETSDPTPATIAALSSIVGTTIDPTMSLGDALKKYGDSVAQSFITTENSQLDPSFNNPGDIKYDPSNPLPGESDSGVASSDGGNWAKFDTQQNGVSAVTALLNTYDPNKTLSESIDTYKNYKGTDLQDQINANLSNTSDPTLLQAQALVSGLIAPSELSKRSTGLQSYNAILAEASKLSLQQTGQPFDSEKADEQFAYGKATTTQNTQAALTYTVSTLNSLKDLSSNVDRGDITFGNQAGEWLQYNGSDPDTVAFITKVNAAIDDVSAAFGGGVSTDTKTEIAKNILDPTLSGDAFNTQINTDLQTVISRQQAIAEQAGQSSPTDATDTSGSGGSGTLTPTQKLAQSKGFDYQAAIAAGYSDQEISDYLNGQ